jgi:hypothetical protein
MVISPSCLMAASARYSSVICWAFRFRVSTINHRKVTIGRLTLKRCASCMAGFHAGLKAGGLLVMPFMSKLWPGRRTPAQMEWLDWRVIGEASRPRDGAAIRRWIRTRYDHQQQLEHEENRYEVLRDGVVIETEHHGRSPCVRWYS